MQHGAYVARGGLVILSLLACAADVDVQRLVLAGSSTLQPLAEVAAQAYEADHPGVEIDVQSGGSAVGLSSARSGMADIGMVSRALRPDEADLTASTVAVDGIALIVHASNPLTALSRDEVTAVFSGAVLTWDGVGGSPRPITVVNKEEGRATLELFEHYTGLKGSFRPDAVIIGPNGQAIATVAGNPDAIAYVSIGAASVAEGVGSPIRRVSLDGVDATPEAVAAGTYPLSRPLNFVTLAEPAGLAADFLAFLRSPVGDDLVRGQDFIPVSR